MLEKSKISKHYIPLNNILKPLPFLMMCDNFKLLEALLKILTFQYRIKIQEIGKISKNAQYYLGPIIHRQRD